MSHEMQSAVNKSQLCLLLLWCTKALQDERSWTALQVTLLYFTMLQKDCVSSFFFCFFPKTFSWRSNDMTVIEVSLRQIYHIESNIAEKGDVFGDLNELTIDIQMIKVVEEFDELTSRIIDAFKSSSDQWMASSCLLIGVTLLSYVIDLAFCFLLPPQSLNKITQKVSFESYIFCNFFFKYLNFRSKMDKIPPRYRLETLLEIFNLEISMIPF